MTTHILGISAYYHDSAAALLRDGEILAAAQEERFTRLKHDARFPAHAVRYCLWEAGIKPEDLEYVAFYEKPLAKFERLIETYIAFAPSGFDSFRRSMPLWVNHRLRMRSIIESELRGFQGRICFVDHHESHAASAFFPSPFEEAAILTLDAVGEWSTSSIGIGEGHFLKLLYEMRFPHSLGMLYSAFTYYSGFKVNSGEYKLMGLAPYGSPVYVEKILHNIASIREDGSVWLDLSYFNYCQGQTMTSEKFHHFFGGPPRQPEDLISQKEMDLAASVQAICEQAVLRAARHAYKRTGKRRLVMAGGVALNCVSNGRLLREGPFDDIWIQPAAGDAGGALGSALLVWHHRLGQPRYPSSIDQQKGSLLGPSFTDADIGLLLDAMDAPCALIKDEQTLIEQVVAWLIEGKVIGWFHGRMEYGPRALGSRSIIGDARSTEMQRIMNLRIKFRESFRPFAPCVLREKAHLVFDVPTHWDSPYMLFVGQVKDQWRIRLSAEDQDRMRDPDLRVRVSVPRSRIPAVTHVDYSARIQTVDPRRHGRFHRLMKRFYEQTGCPVLVNTSFNIRGEPIVCTPEDAYRCFTATDMDCLVLENHLLTKSSHSYRSVVKTDDYKAQYQLD
ncbi:MAG: hypothetical protein EHM23_05280 [Acidobacteria bacterium]|nr:MAG: hypothetical protein EHM23_05280 [Acidobacteriota bacterium]